MKPSCPRLSPDPHTRGAVDAADAWFTDVVHALGMLLLVALCGLLPMPGAAQLLPVPSVSIAEPVARTGAQRVDAVQAELIADVARAAPGQPFRLGLRLQHDPHWHTYWRNPGDSGLPTRFEPGGPPGAAYGEVSWPAPRRLAIGDLANYGYEGEVVLSRQVTLPTGFQGTTTRFEVLAQWLVCREVCIPGEAALALELPVGAPAMPAAAGVVARFDDNARQAPDAAAAIEAGWWRQGARAYLLLPPGLRAGRAEFFPYFEGLIRPAAAQELVEAGSADAAGAAGAPRAGGATVGGPGGMEGLALRLETIAEAASAHPGGQPQQPPGQPGQPPSPSGALTEPPEARAQPPARGLPEPAAGLLLLDGKPIEVGLRSLAVEPTVGRVLSTAEALAAAPTGAGGLLDRLRGGAPVPVSPPASDGAARAFPPPALGAAAGTLGIALAGALLGGLLLNLMPCVFPVIGLKVLSFSQAAAGEPRLARLHALAFSAGVVFSFVALGLVMLALRAGGEAAGWGFQMQSPLFVGAMALLFVLIGLNLFGVFETGISFTRVVLPRIDVPGLQGAGAAVTGPRDARHAATNRPAAGRALANSCATGVIAVLVATPCTAPFMGGAMGYTISSPAGHTLLVFAALGLGMAVPYLVLGSAPRLLRSLPRPGPWLLLFRQFLAFPMLATAAWLTWVLTLQAGADGLLRLLMAAVLVAFAAWLYGRAQAARFAGGPRLGPVGLTAAIVAGLLSVWQLAQIGTPAPGSDTAGITVESGDRSGSGSEAASVAGAAGPVAGAGGTAAGTATGAATGAATGGSPDGVVSDAGTAAAGGVAPVLAASPAWQAWSAQRVSQALAQGRPVLVDFTAAWCISCQVNKKLVLDRVVMREAFEANRVALLRADWTSRDPAITAELARFGRNGVPLYLVYYAADQLPLRLPELLTVDIVLAALAGGR